jgi:hypothetical protein
MGRSIHITYERTAGMTLDHFEAMIQRIRERSGWRLKNQQADYVFPAECAGVNYFAAIVRSHRVDIRSVTLVFIAPQTPAARLKAMVHPDPPEGLLAGYAWLREMIRA